MKKFYGAAYEWFVWFRENLVTFSCGAAYLVAALGVISTGDVWNAAGWGAALGAWVNWVLFQRRTEVWFARAMVARSALQVLCDLLRERGIAVEIRDGEVRLD